MRGGDMIGVGLRRVTVQQLDERVTDSGHSDTYHRRLQLGRYGFGLYLHCNTRHSARSHSRGALGAPGSGLARRPAHRPATACARTSLCNTPLISFIPIDCIL
ncbi:unnamed protein product, partial [Brenthis ino]